MSNLIQATPDELRANGRQFVSHSESIDGIVKQLDSLTQQMQEMWKGSSSEAFVAEYTELQPTMLKFIELIHDVGIQVGSVADALEKADQDIASQIKVN